MKDLPPFIWDVVHAGGFVSIYMDCEDPERDTALLDTIIKPYVPKNRRSIKPIAISFREREENGQTVVPTFRAYPCSKTFFEKFCMDWRFHDGQSLQEPSDTTQSEPMPVPSGK